MTNTPPTPQGEIRQAIGDIKERMSHIDLTNLDHVDVPQDDCWLFAGSINARGYGTIVESHGAKNQKHYRAHRVMYENEVGKIPEGLVIDHLCRIKSCINPTHLEPITILENIARGRVGLYHRKNQLATTCCVNGHPWADGDYVIRTSSNGMPYRQCAVCHRMHTRNSWQKRKQRKSAILKLKGELKA